MTRRDRQHAHGRGMTVIALECLRLRPGVQFLCEIVCVTCSTRHYRNVGVFQCPQVVVAGDPDMTSHAVARMYEIALFVHFGVVKLQ